jgi:hypothetical protein
MKHYFSFLFFFIASISFSQVVNDTTSLQVNAAQKLLNQYDQKLTIGGYANIDYNQPESKNGNLDVHRLIMLFGYKFSDQVQFITEIEFEHVKEVFVEQAFVNYNVGSNINLRGGLMLVPMGIVNEFHEPTTYNGVERPALDSKIVPSTWRELGVGVKGNLPSLSVGYQAYVFNGFKSTSGTPDAISGLLKGENALRGGRQKGAESTISSPTFASKIEYYGLPGLRVGLSGYFGKTQTDDALENIDGSTIGISMVGVDARFKKNKIEARGQLIYASLSDTEAYNLLTQKDLGSSLFGYYIEGGYNILPITAKQRLIAFARFETYNTHASTAGTLSKNDAYDRTDVTFGLSYHIAQGVVVKGDYQLRDNKLDNNQTPNQLNFGLGIWF